MPGWGRPLAPIIVDQDDGIAYRVVGRQDQYSFVAGRIVRQAWREAPPSLVMAPRNLIDTVEHMLRVRGRRRVMVRWTAQTLGSVAAAGVVAAGLFLVISRRPLISSQEPGHLKHPETVAADRQPDILSSSLRDPRSMFVVAGSVETHGRPFHQGPVEAGASLAAPETGQVRIASAEGTELTLEPGASLTVVEAGTTKRFALTRGAVQAHVKKLLVDERFIVQTTDAEIEVHGTQFRVVSGEAAPACGKATTTRVLVSEGVVTVRSSGHEERLFPGDDWRSKCLGGNARLRVEASVQNRSTALRKARRVSGPSFPEGVSPAGTASVLAAQNDLFTAAVRAKRAGRTSDALNLFERFIRDYPSSSLVESALAQRMRLFALRDPQAAARAATEYLAQFPDGFARGEAHTLVTATARL